MTDLYGVGCAKCNDEIATAQSEMPKMDGYLDADKFHQRYGQLSGGNLPKVYLDGGRMDHVICIVPGGDGWVLCGHLTQTDKGRKQWMSLCTCQSEPRRLMYEVWRGKVELRDV